MQVTACLSRLEKTFRPIIGMHVRAAMDGLTPLDFAEHPRGGIDPCFG